MQARTMQASCIAVCNLSRSIDHSTQGSETSNGPDQTRPFTRPAAKTSTFCSGHSAQLMTLPQLMTLSQLRRAVGGAARHCQSDSSTAPDLGDPIWPRRVPVPDTSSALCGTDRPAGWRRLQPQLAAQRSCRSHARPLIELENVPRFVGDRSGRSRYSLAVDKCHGFPMSARRSSELSRRELVRCSCGRSHKE